MAYSSITHIGWMVRLAAISKSVSTIVYFFIYSMLIAPIFIVFQKFSVTTRLRINKLMAKAPILQVAMPILLLSLGGLPPLTGFIPKWITIEILSNSNPYILIILIAGAIINLYFYLNITFNIILTQSLSLNPIHKFLHMPKISLIVSSLIILFVAPILFLLYAMTIFY